MSLDEKCDCGYELRNCLKCLNREVEEYHSLVQMIHKREMQVMPLFREKTGCPENCFPDHGRMLIWLVEELEKVRKDFKWRGEEITRLQQELLEWNDTYEKKSLELARTLGERDGYRDQLIAYHKAMAELSEEGNANDV